jgi:protein TonB
MFNRDLLVAVCIAFIFHAGVFLISSPQTTTLPEGIEKRKMIEISLSEIPRPKPLLSEPVNSPKKVVKSEDKRTAEPGPKSQSQPHQSQPQSEPKIMPPTEIPSPTKEIINEKDAVSRKQEIKEGNETSVTKDNDEGTNRGRPIASTIDGWRVSGGDSIREKNKDKPVLPSTAPSLIENPKPPYPMIARRRKMEGVVLLRVEVLADGGVGEIEVKRSSGYNILDETALRAVKKWRFLPATLNGISVKVWASIPIRFELE